MGRRWRGSQTTCRSFDEYDTETRFRFEGSGKHLEDIHADITTSTQGRDRVEEEEAGEEFYFHFLSRL